MFKRAFTYGISGVYLIDVMILCISLYKWFNVLMSYVYIYICIYIYIYTPTPMYIYIYICIYLFALGVALILALVRHLRHLLLDGVDVLESKGRTN